MEFPKSFRLFIIVVVLTGFRLSVIGQVSDSLIIKQDKDSLDLSTSDTIKASSNLGVDLRTPRTAMLRSVMLPGLGQFYNKQYWKIPIVYGALTGLYFAARNNTKIYRKYRNYYIQAIEGKNIDYPNISPSSFKSIRDQARKNMELNYIAMVGIYGLNVLDAFVSAHLKSFDINEDIGMSIHPKFENIDLGYSKSPSAGISFKLFLH